MCDTVSSGLRYNAHYSICLEITAERRRIVKPAIQHRSEIIIENLPIDWFGVSISVLLSATRIILFSPVFRRYPAIQARVQIVDTESPDVDTAANIRSNVATPLPLSLFLSVPTNLYAITRARGSRQMQVACLFPLLYDSRFR